MWAMLIVRGFPKGRGLTDLVIDARRFPGTLQFVLPPPLFPKDPIKQAEGFKVISNKIVKQWIDRHGETARRLYHEAKYPKAQYDLLARAMGLVAKQSPLAWQGGRIGTISGLPISPKNEHVIFFRINPPAGAKVGSAYEFDILQRESKTGTPQGGSRYRVVVNRESRRKIKG
jgi:hypothetical protein